MKKLVILLALLVSGISFSATCQWIKDSNIYVRREIELINRARLKEKVYCDVEHDFMTYYIGVGNLEVGLIYNQEEKKELTYENIFKILADFEKDIAKLIPTNLFKSEQKNKPRYYTYRLYIYDDKHKDTFMFFKYILDTNKVDGDWKMYYNNEIFSKVSNRILQIFKSNGYDPTEDIIY